MTIDDETGLGLVVAPISLGIADEVVVFGERCAGRTDAAVVVLLHDRGSDLDSLRWLRTALVGDGFTVVSLDLPGHGLSDGDYDRDCQHAIESAAEFADPDGHLGVAFVAVGSTGVQLLRARPSNPIASVLIWSQARTDSSYDTSVWPRTPALLIVDPTDRDGEAAASALFTRARAWNVRAFVHREHESAGTAGWHVHAASMVSRFVLEQDTYWKSRSKSLPPGS